MKGIELMEKMVNEVCKTANKVKEDYIRAYIADEYLATNKKPNMKDYELVEQRDMEKGIITFYVRKKLGRKKRCA